MSEDMGSMSYDFAAMREAMVESQLRTTGVDDPRVIKAMATVPREDFVPEERRSLAYAETLLSLGSGRRMNLPMATAKLLTELRLQSSDRLLVIGAATGYAAAVCAHLAGSVVALESDTELAQYARGALSGHGNVTVVEGPLEKGWHDAAPYDAILIDGAVAQIGTAIPAQLAGGGRLAAGLIEEGVTRLVYGRSHAGAFGYSAFADALSAPLPGFETVRAFAF